jgi:pyruvate/2-oxoglutarate/acetoin dehydrogenase E1 component
MKGLMKASFYDPNPVVMLEHKGLYWSKVPGTLEAKTIEPDEDYIIPLGKASQVQIANEERVNAGESAVVITYGMGVYWAKEASQSYKGQIEIIDLRTLKRKKTWPCVCAYRRTIVKFFCRITSRENFKRVISFSGCTSMDFWCC